MLPGGFRLVDLREIWAAICEHSPLAGQHCLEACEAGTGLCFSGEWGAFVIALGPGENPSTLEAFVLVAIATRNGAFDAAEPAVLQVARDLKATTVAFRSVRRGWARRLGPAWMPRGTREFWRYVDEPKVGQPDQGNAPTAGDG